MIFGKIKIPMNNILKECKKVNSFSQRLKKGGEKMS